jgi:Secretion system C-terminal sorting domain/Beta-propeller repeat
MKNLSLLLHSFAVEAILFCLISVFSVTLKAQCPLDLWTDEWEVKATGVYGGNDIISDADQNVYAIGEDQNADPFGLLVVKYDKTGQELWRQVYVESRSQTSALSIEFDHTGNIVVAGLAPSLGRVVTVSYTPDGEFRWANSFEHPGFPYVNPRDLATDKNGNAYVAGSLSSDGVSTSFDAFVVKINNDGQLVWSSIYNGPANQLDIATKVRTDKYGHVIIAGETNTNSDFLIVKYDQNGVQKWVRTYSGPGNGLDMVTDMEVTASAAVMVTGYSILGRATIRYDKNGNQKWVRFADGPYNSEHSMAVDHKEGVLISSTIETLSGVETTRYNKYGNIEWVRTYLAPNTLERDIQVDEKQNAYVLGANSGMDPTEAVVIVYKKNGQILYLDSHSFGNSEIYVRELALSCGGNFYFSAWDDYGQSDVTTVRYSACENNSYVKKCNSATSNMEEEGDLETKDLVTGKLDVWPNPTLQNTQIRFVNPVEGEVSFVLFNIHGAVVKSIWKGQAEAEQNILLELETGDLASGIYMLRCIGSNGTVHVRKISVQR